MPTQWVGRVSQRQTSKGRLGNDPGYCNSRVCGPDFRVTWGDLNLGDKWEKLMREYTMTRDDKKLTSVPRISKSMEVRERMCGSVRQAISNKVLIVHQEQQESGNYLLV